MELVSPWHANIGDILSRIFNEGVRGRFRVRVQYPINLGQMSQPQPDLVLYRPGMWRGQHPGAADISLVVQISDSSLSFDLGQKLALYKAKGIQEYWVVEFSAGVQNVSLASASRKLSLSARPPRSLRPSIRVPN